MNAIQHPLVGTLCQHVVASGFCAFLNQVQRRVPQNQALMHFGGDSYVGIILYNSLGEESGIIYVMDKRLPLHGPFGYHSRSWRGERRDYLFVDLLLRNADAQQVFNGFLQVPDETGFRQAIVVEGLHL